MQRLRDDRGAVAVLTALLLVPLLVCAALVADIGFDYVQQRQLQNAADASALAIAQDCGKGKDYCLAPDNQTTADYFTSKNAPGGAATATVAAVTKNMVTVTTKATVNYAFAPVIGIKSKAVTAKATASWVSPTSGTAVLPLAFSKCAFEFQAGAPHTATAQVITLPKTDDTSCTGPSGNPLPGAFGWLDTVGNRCTAYSSAGTEAFSKPGRSVPNDCRQVFPGLHNKIVLLPLYNAVNSTKPGGGNNVEYFIYAYAAFNLTGYSFPGLEWNAPCKKPDDCIGGNFTTLVEPSDAFTYGAGAPGDFGTQVIRLTPEEVSP